MYTWVNMTSCYVSETLVDLGIVMIKFDQSFGPLILHNHSFLNEDQLMKVALKGTTTLMNGLSYNLSNTRRFRGMFQLSEELFVYGFDLLLIDDQSDDGSFVPVLVFLVFPTCSVPIVGSSIRSIEEILFKHTKTIVNLTNLTPEIVVNMLSSLQGIMA